MLVLDPEGVIMEHALRFNFKTFNNGAKYEALIVGLKMAKDLNIKKLKFFNNSQLVIEQIWGHYEIKDPIISQYLHNVKELSENFDDLQII